jgi:DNA-binding protein HU-beta
MARDSDQFEIRARTLLRDDPKLLSDLLTLRAEAQKLSAPARQKVNEPTASELNSDNQRMLDRAAALLGPDKFERIFEFSPSERVELVDAKILRAEQRGVVRQESPTPVFRAAIHPVRMYKTPSTVTLKNLAAALSEEHELSRKQTEAILDDLVVRVTKHLKKGARIRIVGLGILQVRKRAARMGRNPATGEAIQIKASKKVAFRPAKDLKDAI